MTDSETRLTAVRRELEDRQLDGLLVTQSHNRRYLTGFTGSSGLAVITATEAHLLTDPRYLEQAEQQAPGWSLVEVRGPPYGPLSRLLAEQKVRRIGFEADTVTVSELERLRTEVSGVEWVATSGLVETHRAVKSAAEIEHVRRAARLTDEALARVVPTMRPGMTERAVAWELERYMREHGAEGVAFPPIVAAGPNGARPHHEPGGRCLRAGEPIVIDIGARLNGYCGDLTRTLTLGSCDDPDYERVYELVTEANRVAREAIRPGMTGAEVDRLARDLIEEAGFGPYFGHGLGHGVGLDIHERPRLSTASQTTLAEGMVVTIEPGVYLPGRFGVRIEDLVVVRDGGAELLSGAAKEPMVVPA